MPPDTNSVDMTPVLLALWGHLREETNNSKRILSLEDIWPDSNHKQNKINKTKY